MRLCVIQFTTLVIIAVSTIGGTRNERLAQMPLPQRNFVLERYLGGWYVQGMTIMWTWPGCRKFSDFFTSYQLRPDKLTLLTTWRSIECTTAVHTYTPTEIPGKFVLIDSIGDLITGDSVIVATDYRTFSVVWACSHRTVLGECDSPYIVIKSKRRFPHPRTWQIIRNIVFNNWGLAMADIKLYSQLNPC